VLTAVARLITNVAHAAPEHEDIIRLYGALAQPCGRFGAQMPEAARGGSSSTEMKDHRLLPLVFPSVHRNLTQ
jgi:hypothetical protein